MKDPIIVGIESSCDDTSVAVLQGNKILSNVINSQKIHQKYGGVVPELASRAHLRNIIPVFTVALQEANISLKNVNAIAFTQGPGLMGSLLVGSSFAKSLSQALSIPLIGVNHMQAHIFANFYDEKNSPDFPFLCLTVSGGHTQIVKIESIDSLEVIGETKDDAAGEAFDKIGKMLGLPYPAGPWIDQHSKTGNKNRFDFTKPKMDAYNFSFSGLKTAVKYFLEKKCDENPNFIQENLNDLCASIQKIIAETLLENFLKASKNLNIKNLVLAGGVSANSLLRNKFLSLEKENYSIHIPPIELTTDNAAMIAIVGRLKYENALFSDLSVTANPRLKL